MANKIFELIGSVMVDSKDAENSLQKTDKKATNVGATLAKGIGTAAKWGAAIGTAAIAATGALVGLTNEAAKNADTIDKQSQKMQISTDEYQKLAYAAELTGTNMDRLQAAQKKLLSEGSDLSLTDALKQCADASDVAAAATEMFGAKTAQELLPMLNQGADGIEAMMQQADDLGLVMSEDAVKAGASYQDTLATLQKTVTALGNKLGTALMPIVEKVMNVVIEHMPQIQSMIDQVAPILVSFLEEMLPILLNLGEQILPIVFDLIQQLMPAITQIASTIFPVIAQILGDIAPILADLVATILPVLMEIFEAIWPALESILTLLSPLLELINILLKPLLMLIELILPPLCDLISTIVGWISGKLGEGMKWLSNWLTEQMPKIKQFFDNVKQWFGDLWGKISGFFGNLKTNATNICVKLYSAFTSFGNKIKTFFSGIGQALGNIFKKPINFIINGINTFLQGINKVKIPDWVPLVGGKGFNIPLIPELAKGGVLEKGQVGFLEGNGAEAVVPLENNKKWISKVADEMDSVGGSKILEEILSKLNDIADMGIYLDGKALVGGISNEMDKKLGAISARKVRA